MPSLAELEPALPVLPTPADAQDTAQAPPVYATQVPAPARLRFVAKVNGQTGSAVLDWQHDGQRYRATLRVQGPQRPLIEQESTGAFDAHGLAPERFVDRRRGRLVGAAHFRRDSARISFSGPQTDYPAWPGAQDRLAWLPQLVAVAAAAANAAANAAASAQADSASAAPTEISLFVADARGLARLWVFQAMGEDAVVTDGGSVPALRWLRAPQRSDELRVEVWLDPARGHWPVRLVQTAPFSGAVVDLVRSEAPP